MATFHSSFNEDCIPSTPIPDKDTIRKLQANITHDYECKYPKQCISNTNREIYKKRVNTVTNHLKY